MIDLQRDNKRSRREGNNKDNNRDIPGDHSAPAQYLEVINRRVFNFDEEEENKSPEEPPAPSEPDINIYEGIQNTENTECEKKKHRNTGNRLMLFLTEHTVNYVSPVKLSYRHKIHSRYKKSEPPDT